MKTNLNLGLKIGLKIKTRRH